MFQRKIRSQNYVKERETSFDLLFTCLLIMEFHFVTLLCFNLSNDNSDAGHIKCSSRSQLPHPALNFRKCRKNVPKKGKFGEALGCSALASTRGPDMGKYRPGAS